MRGGIKGLEESDKTLESEWTLRRASLHKLRCTLFTFLNSDVFTFTIDAQDVQHIVESILKKALEYSRLVSRRVHSTSHMALTNLSGMLFA